VSVARFNDPFQVVHHPQLEPEVKRAILASWASDAHAVEDRPAFRHPPHVAQPQHFDDVMTALRQLDGGSC
jgi:hypothetical protein